VPRLPPLGIAFLVLVALAMFAPGFFALPAVDRDEARYAQATRQMLESGDFVDIRFQDQPRHKQPVGIYWLQSLSALLFSDDPQRAPMPVFRAPSALGAIASVLLTASTAALLFGPSTAMVAGLLLAGCLLLGFEARSAKTDACLLAAVVLAQATMARCYLGEAEKRTATSAWPFWLGAAAAILIKGPTVLIVCGATALALVVADRRYAWLKRLGSRGGALIFLAIVVPWLVAIAMRSEGEFFARAGSNSLGKILTGRESHGAPPGYYVVAYWFTFWPFALLGLAGLRWAWRHRGEAAARFCLAWIVPTWGMFELVATKLPHYVLPVYPAIAIVAARALLEPRGADEQRRDRFSRVAGYVYIAAGLILGGALLLLPWYVHGAPVLAGILAGVAATLTTLASVHAYRTASVTVRVGVPLVGALVVYWLTYASLFPGLSELWLGPRAAALVTAQRSCDDTPVAVAGYGEPSLIFALGKDIRIGDAASAARVLAAEPRCALALIAAASAGEFGAALAAAGHAPKPLGSVRGFNYTKGQWIELTLYAAGGP